MTNDSPRDSVATFARLLRNSAISLAVCGALVWICYEFVDRPVARFVFDWKTNQDFVLKDLTYPPPVAQQWSPLILALLMIRRARGPFRRWEWALCLACVALVLADQFRESLRDVCGRSWPETWIDNNPSYIRDGAYGFHVLQGSEEFGSFPSGHAARTLAVLAIAWIASPRWRWACGVAAVAEAAGLIGMNYHFVSDVIAGGFLGALVGVYTAHLGGLTFGDAAPLKSRL